MTVRSHTNEGVIRQFELEIYNPVLHICDITSDISSDILAS